MTQSSAFGVFFLIISLTRLLWANFFLLSYQIMVFNGDLYVHAHDDGVNSELMTMCRNL